jgi:hypothetical protein
LKWTESAFWDCSWRGFADAWNGHHRFMLGFDPDDRPVSREEARRLDRHLSHWQRTGIWQGEGDD